MIPAHSIGRPQNPYRVVSTNFGLREMRPAEHVPAPPLP